MTKSLVLEDSWMCIQWMHIHQSYRHSLCHACQPLPLESIKRNCLLWLYRCLGQDYIFVKGERSRQQTVLGKPTKEFQGLVDMLRDRVQSDVPGATTNWTLTISKQRWNERIGLRQSSASG